MEELEKTKKNKISVFGKNLKAAREMRALSGIAFAELMDIPYPTLRDIESGASFGSSTTRKKVAAALGIEPASLDIPNFFEPSEKETDSIATIKNALKEVIAENSHVLTDREKRILAVGDVIPVEVLEAMAKDWKILKKSIPRIVGVSIKELEKAEQDLSQIKTKKRA